MMLPEGYVVVTLRPTMFGQDSVEEGAILAVSREVRNNLVAGNIARDASDEEVAEYRADEESAEALLGDVDGLEAQKKALEAELDSLGERHGALSSAVAALEGQKGTLSGEVADLAGKKATLAGEVADLEKAKAAAAKPATAAKSK